MKLFIRVAACSVFLLQLVVVCSTPLWAAVLTPTDARQMHRYGVRIKIPGTHEPEVVPEGIDLNVLKQAEYLDFNGKQVRVLPPWIAGFTALKGINLRDAYIDYTQLSHLKTLKKLEQLDLGDNPLFSSGSAESEAAAQAMSELWQSLPELRGLKLDNTGGNSEYGDLSPLDHLLELDLGHNRISSVTSLSLHGLASLKKLNLSDNAIDAFSFADMPESIQSVVLADNSIDSISYTVNLPQLHHLDLSNNDRGLRIDPKYEGMFVLGELVSLTLNCPSDAVSDAMWEKVRLQSGEPITADLLACMDNVTPAMIKEAVQTSLPGMVDISKGCFQMGSPEAEPNRDSDERLHEVCVDRFLIGEYEVTFAQYDLFARATRSQKLPSDNWGRGNQPVINVSWHDAVAYAAWLSAQTGKAFRLPTEAEWEYAARAGTVTPFSTGPRISTEQANFDGNYIYNGSSAGVYRQKTLPVGSFEPNAWGLYDVHGNVWEWTCSAYDAAYGGAEKQYQSTGDDSRVLRGGSWISEPQNLRSANRSRRTPDYRDFSVGFRLAQDAP